MCNLRWFFKGILKRIKFASFVVPLAQCPRFPSHEAVGGDGAKLVVETSGLGNGADVCPSSLVAIIAIDY